MSGNCCYYYCCCGCCRKKEDDEQALLHDDTLRIKIERDEIYDDPHKKSRSRKTNSRSISRQSSSKPMEIFSAKQKRNFVKFLKGIDDKNPERLEHFVQRLPFSEEPLGKEEICTIYHSYLCVYLRKVEHRTTLPTEEQTQYVCQELSELMLNHFNRTYVTPKDFHDFMPILVDHFAVI